MPYLVKNTGKVDGTVFIDGHWVNIKPGDSVKSQFKPRHLSLGLKSVQLIQDPSLKVKDASKSSVKTGKKE